MTKKGGWDTQTAFVELIDAVGLIAWMIVLLL